MRKIFKSNWIPTEEIQFKIKADENKVLKNKYNNFNNELKNKTNFLSAIKNNNGYDYISYLKSNKDSKFNNKRVNCKKYLKFKENLFDEELIQKSKKTLDLENLNHLKYKQKKIKNKKWEIKLFKDSNVKLDSNQNFESQSKFNILENKESTCLNSYIGIKNIKLTDLKSFWDQKIKIKTTRLDKLKKRGNLSNDTLKRKGKKIIIKLNNKKKIKLNGLKFNKKFMSNNQNIINIHKFKKISFKNIFKDRRKSYVLNSISYNINSIKNNKKSFKETFNFK